jgi:tRNA-dihydrouridine synthase 2
LNTHWSLAKFCVNQFKSSRLDVTKAESQALRVTLSQAKSYSAVQGIMGVSSGQEDFQQILDTLGANPPNEHRMIIDASSSIVDSDEEKIFITPDGTQNPEPPGSGAPFLPNDMDGNFLSRLPGHDATTPTPTEIFPAHI